MPKTDTYDGIILNTCVAYASIANCAGLWTRARLSMFEMLNAWRRGAEKLYNGELSKEEYDAWHYNYLRIEVERAKAEPDALRVKRNAEPIEKE